LRAANQERLAELDGKIKDAGWLPPVNDHSPEITNAVVKPSMGLL
jgi:hypothetical protein